MLLQSGPRGKSPTLRQDSDNAQSIGTVVRFDVQLFLTYETFGPSAGRFELSSIDDLCGVVKQSNNAPDY